MTNSFGNTEWALRRRLLLFWLIPAAMGTLGFQLVPSRLNPDLTLVALITVQVAMWGAWALWTALTWVIGDVLAARRNSPWVQVPAYAAWGAIVILSQILIQARIGVAFGIAEQRGLESTLVIGIRSYGDFSAVVFMAIVVSQLAMRWYASWQLERLQAARAAEALAEARLRALQVQLQPHFLFNTLNSIVSLIGRDPPQAQALVVRVADLLRSTLRLGDAQEIPLRQELELTRQYLDIERIRFADRLTVVWPTTALPDALVPAFAVQVLVENAVRHGIARNPAAGVITLHVGTTDSTLSILVHDTGAATDSGADLTADSIAAGSGTSLRTLRERLSHLYGARGRLDLRPTVAGGTDAELIIPLLRTGGTAEFASA
ncbi:MAG: histidine kinase [Gemmatimonadaceae bacterium]|nr:histidine kinase [Gemmatimonadaceae bacterium]